MRSAFRPIIQRLQSRTPGDHPLLPEIHQYAETRPISAAPDADNRFHNQLTHVLREDAECLRAFQQCAGLEAKRAQGRCKSRLPRRFFNSQPVRPRRAKKAPDQQRCRTAGESRHASGEPSESCAGRDLGLLSSPRLHDVDEQLRRLYNSPRRVAGKPGGQRQYLNAVFAEIAERQ